jgi:predicted GNAT family acetyltransferase
VIEDGRLNRRMPDQPYNLAMVTLDADPRVNFYSNLHEGRSITGVYTPPQLRGHGYAGSVTAATGRAHLF